MLQFQHRATSPNRHFVSINYVWSIYHAGNVSYVNWKQNAANSWNGWFTMIWQCGADRSFYGLTSIRFLSCSHVKKNLAAFRSICKGLLYNEASYIHGILIPYITLTFRFNFHLLYILECWSWCTEYLFLMCQSARETNKRWLNKSVKKRYQCSHLIIRNNDTNEFKGWDFLKIIT